MTTANTENLFDPIGDVIRADIKRELPVKLTDAELLAVAKAKANSELELEELQAQFADTKRGWNDRIEVVENRITQAGREIRTGEQKRVVQCYERFVNGNVETVRRDLDPRDPTSVVDRRAANLFEATSRGKQGSEPDGEADEPEADSDEAADAARTQRDANVEEDDEGDVVPPEGNGKKPKKGKRK